METVKDEKKTNLVQTKNLRKKKGGKGGTAGEGRWPIDRKSQQRGERKSSTVIP